MAFYLSVCRQKSDKKDFLLISEQKLDLKLPLVKAQIYFETPPASLEDEKLEISSFPVSKKEVEILLNKTKQRESTGFRTKGLFAEGRVDKKALFNIFAYPSVIAIDQLLKAIDIKQSKTSNYHQLKIIPDKDHILNNRHHIYWEKFLKLNPRQKLDIGNWNNYELRENDLLYEFNLTRLFLNEQYDIPIEA